MAERILVTGVLGCLGAWVSRVALEAGHDVIGYDLGDDRSRLELVLGTREGAVTLVRGDITDLDGVERVLDEQAVTRVVHLAALQVPFVRANPPLGMRVNVAGTVNVFDAVSRRLDRIPLVAYTSSAAVYTPDDPCPAPESGGFSPRTLYGVSKLADEGMARVYATDAGLASVGLRPYVVYGPGRDQGLTSGPTVAMLAAARGEPFEIGFTGRAQYDYVADVARALLIACMAELDGAHVFNTPGEVADVDDVIAAIRRAAPEVAGTSAGPSLPFPEELEATGFDDVVGLYPRTSLTDGVAATIARFRELAG